LENPKRWGTRGGGSAPPQPKKTQRNPDKEKHKGAVQKKNPIQNPEKRGGGKKVGAPKGGVPKQKKKKKETGGGGGGTHPPWESPPATQKQNPIGGVKTVQGEDL